jgi:hypothetical protein
MSPINVYICSGKGDKGHKKDAKVAKSKIVTNGAGAQLAFDFGIRDGKKKLSKGSYLIGVDLQWNSIAE